MPTYITLATLTDQGIRTMKELPRRLQNAEATFHKMGAELKQIYLVMGAYDYVIISEAPNDEAAAKVALAVSGQGNVRTQTFRAFDRQDILRLVEDLP